AKGVRRHAVRFIRSASLNRSSRNPGFFSSKCTCMSTIRSPGLSVAVSPGERVNGDSSCRLRAPQLGARPPPPAPRNARRDHCFSILVPSLSPAPCDSCRPVGLELNDVLFLDDAQKKVKSRLSDSFTRGRLYGTSSHALFRLRHPVGTLNSIAAGHD